MPHDPVLEIEGAGPKVESRVKPNVTERVKTFIKGHDKEIGKLAEKVDRKTVEEKDLALKSIGGAIHRTIDKLPVSKKYRESFNHAYNAAVAGTLAATLFVFELAVATGTGGLSEVPGIEQAINVVKRYGTKKLYEQLTGQKMQKTDILEKGAVAVAGGMMPGISSVTLELAAEGSRQQGQALKTGASATWDAAKEKTAEARAYINSLKPKTAELQPAF
jgi:hypothetical protein